MPLPARHSCYQQSEPSRGCAAATSSVAVGLWPKAVNAVLAALPGLMYLANRQFRFEERSKWWFEKFYVIEGWYRGLVRERRDEAEISKELTLQSLKELGWTKARELAKLAHAWGQDFDCAPWVHKARAMPREEFEREVEKELTGRETEPFELMYSSSTRARFP